jgi:hypothetical protein
MKLITAVVLVLLAVASSANANLVTNGGFEAGSLSDWGVTAAPQSILTVAGPLYGAGVHSGAFAAQFAAPGCCDDTITQTIVPTIHGVTYELTFWLAQNGQNFRNDFSVSWDGQTLLDLVNVPAFGYTEYAYIVTAMAPGATLRFAGRNGSGWYGLDDVSVTEAQQTVQGPGGPQPVSEPASLAFAGFTILALSAVVRLRSAA